MPEQGPPCRVLVVDDSDVVRQALYDLLVDAGFDVELAVDGADAWDRVQARPRFDAIVLDLQMPVMGGERFLAMRTGSPCEDVPVIVLSAFLDAGQARALSRRLGCVVLDKTGAAVRLVHELSLACQAGRAR